VPDRQKTVARTQRTKGKATDLGGVLGYGSIKSTGRYRLIKHPPYTRMAAVQPHRYSNRWKCSVFACIYHDLMLQKKLCKKAERHKVFCAWCQGRQTGLNASAFAARARENGPRNINWRLLFQNKILQVQCSHVRFTSWPQLLYRLESMATPRAHLSVPDKGNACLIRFGPYHTHAGSFFWRNIPNRTTPGISYGCRGAAARVGWFRGLAGYQQATPTRGSETASVLKGPPLANFKARGFSAKPLAYLN